jgi:hypothetical protein
VWDHQPELAMWKLSSVELCRLSNAINHAFQEIKKKKKKEALLSP